MHDYIRDYAHLLAKDDPKDLRTAILSLITQLDQLQRDNAEVQKQLKEFKSGSLDAMNIPFSMYDLERAARGTYNDSLVRGMASFLLRRVTP